MSALCPLSIPKRTLIRPPLTYRDFKAAIEHRFARGYNDRLSQLRLNSTSGPANSPRHEGNLLRRWSSI